MNTVIVSPSKTARQAAQSAARAAVALYRAGCCKQAAAIWHNAMEALK